MPLRNAVQLICYPDHIGQNMRDLKDALDAHCGDAIGGIHLLPFYPSNADAGFSPLTHTEIDERFGTWDDFEALSSTYDVCVDLVLNHISDESVEFQDYLEHGRASKYAPLFVDVDQMPEFSHDDLAKIHIRKEKEPFRTITFADGTSTRVWCTFTERQIDLNFKNQETYDLISGYIKLLTEKGARLLRLDAFGYTTKEVGTSCFLVEPEVYRILEWVRDEAERHGAECLPEVHDHWSYQYALSRRGMRPYGFALPPLLLYSLLDANSVYLKNWLRMCPDNMITVLDTHDGICIPDVEGVLPADKIAVLIDNIDARSADPILRRSAANIHSVGAIYQLTCTFYDALMRNDDAYIAARAIQFFTPGIPQVYYVGLLAGCNDEELMEKSGELRDINRRYYTPEEFAEAVDQPVVQRLLKLMRFRSQFPAFDGQFELQYSNDTSVAMSWSDGDSYCELNVELNFNISTIRYRESQDAPFVEFRA